MWVHDLRDAGPSSGGKASGLARLLAAQLPVPPGFVIDDGAFRSIVGELAIVDTAEIGHVLEQAARKIASAEIPDELLREVDERVRELGHLVVVRSSATIEDNAVGAAAGVFSSRRAVPVEHVWDAIRAVWTSALTPLAATYARRRGGGITIGVIVQEHVPGVPVVVYTRPPGYPGSQELLVQRMDHVARHSRDDLPREIEAQHAAILALRAEQAIGARDGADVELVQIRKQSGFDVAIETVVVQARPIVHPTPRTLVPPPPSVLAPLQDGRTWTWDVAHNPDPLSVAQQGLVERVEQAAIAPWSLRVCGGFLYSASRGEELPQITDEHELATRAAELEARLARTLDAEQLSVSEAIERYLAFYAIWARELSPLIAAARAGLPAALRRSGHPRADTVAPMLVGSRASSVETTLLAAARGELDDREIEERLGILAPAWDVAVPTFGERPGVLADAIARAGAAADRAAAPKPEPIRHELEREDLVTLPPPRRPEPREDLDRLATAHAKEIALARRAADLAERDDALFARAQLIVRRALLARAAELAIASDDIFWLPFDDLLNPLDPDDAHRRAGAARTAAERAAQWQMPVVVGDTQLTEGPSLHGLGTGPRVSGRVVRFASLASAVAVGAGDVVVTRAVTPALAVLVAGCAALVSETGGLLDHGAALARELGIPCVVGCRDAWTQLSDAMLVTVDGDAGTVTILVAIRQIDTKT